MRPRTKYILIALLINLAMLLQGPNSPTRAVLSQPRVEFPCCQTTEAGHDFCCLGCCLHRWDCRSDRDCRVGQQ